eukprot:8792283-Alexandrium_andersonii.AAC.1
MPYGHKRSIQHSACASGNTQAQADVGARALLILGWDADTPMPGAAAPRRRLFAAPTADRAPPTRGVQGPLA